MTRVTAQDVAKAAGVSMATVDRVLNKRKGVRETTIQRVVDAMDRLNFVRDQTAANLARGRSYTFTFIVPAGETSLKGPPSALSSRLRSRTTFEKFSLIWCSDIF